MTRNDLVRKSREELIQMVLIEYAQLEASQKLMAEMKLEIEALKLKMEKNKKPPTNSNNSSQPPSRGQKVNLPKERKRHRHGQPVGHVKYERKMVARPDHMVEVKPRSCREYQTDLREEPGKVVDVNQIIELPEAKAEVIKVWQYEVRCPCCGKKQVVEPPEGLEMIGAIQSLFGTPALPLPMQG